MIDNTADELAAEWTKIRDRLVARREELLIELRQIDTTLGSSTISAINNCDRFEEYLKTHSNTTSREIAAAIGTTVSQACNILSQLLNRKLVARDRKNVGGQWRWSLVTDTRKKRTK
jgi:hypothetical protein